MNRAVMQRQMFAQGGEAGLPDFNKDGKITRADVLIGRGVDLKKLQMGGEPRTAPSAMPTDMSGIAGMLGQTEQAMAQSTEQLGQEYAQNMMAGIEGAEDFKTMIDSLRGNQLPIDARYQELASYVGPEDAQKTPESVLTLVQPTLMMTEEGAMDSGIGDLMKNLTAQVDMEFGDGAPTAMGQGVGSVLMAGSQEPVQAFRDGGVVKKYNVGGVASPNDPALHEAFYVGNRMSPGFAGQVPEAAGTTTARSLPSLEKMYERTLPIYQKILGQDQASKDASKAQILFDVARRGLAFAGGVNPDTGESMAGKSPIAQFATAAQTLPSVMGQQVAEQRKLDQGAKLGALEAAQGQYAAQLEAALKTFNVAEGGTLINAQGEVIARGTPKQKKPIVGAPGSQFMDPDDPTKVIHTVPAKPDKPNIQFLITADGTVSEAFDLSKDSDYETVMNLLKTDPQYKGAFLSKTPSFSASQEDSNYVVDKNRLQRIKDGTATEDELIKFQQLAGKLYKGTTKEITGPDGQTSLAKVPAIPMPQQVAEVLKLKFGDLYNSIQKDAGGIIDPRVHQPSLGDNNLEGSAEYAKNYDPIAYALDMTVYMPWEQGGQPPIERDQIFATYDFSKAVGFPGFYNQVANTVVDLFTDRLADEEAASALETMNSVLVDLDQLAILAFPGRPSVSYLETFRLLNPEPGKLFVGNAQNAAKMNKLIDKIKAMEIELVRRAYGPYSVKTKEAAQEGLLGLRPILARASIIRNGLNEAVKQSKAIDSGTVPESRSSVDFSGQGQSMSLLQKHMKPKESN